MYGLILLVDQVVARTDSASLQMEKRLLTYTGEGYQAQSRGPSKTAFQLLRDGLIMV